MPRSHADDEMLQHLDLLLSYEALDQEESWDLFADVQADPDVELDSGADIEASSAQKGGGK